MGPGIAILAAFFLLPSLYNIWLSFFDISLFEIRTGGTFIGIDNYLRLLARPQFGRVLYNTVFWLTFVTVAIRLVAGLALALLVNSDTVRRWRLSSVSRSCVLLPWVTPEVVAVAAWQWLLHPRFGAVSQILVQAGVLNEGIPVFVQISTVWLGIVTILVWRELPFVTISLLAGLQSIPTELYECAHVEGATRVQTFRHITLPLLRPVLAVITLLITIWTFNNFLYVWLATRGGPGSYTQVLATELYTQAFTNYRLGFGASMGVVMTLAMVLFSVVYFRTVFRRSMDDR